MRKLFIACSTLAEARAAAPWAASIVKCEGGYMAFESDADCDLWEMQS